MVKGFLFFSNNSWCKLFSPLCVLFTRFVQSSFFHKADFSTEAQLFFAGGVVEFRRFLSPDEARVGKTASFLFQVDFSSERSSAVI